MQRITNEIIVFIPTIFDKTTKTFIPPNDSLQLKLCKMILQKELHESQNRCIQKWFNGTCKFGVWYSPHIELFFKLKKREYYRPQHENRNVVPYHPTLLPLWETHFNILCITFSYWSFYLLKYAMKCETHGKLNLNTKNVEWLGFLNAS